MTGTVEGSAKLQRGRERWGWNSGERPPCTSAVIHIPFQPDLTGEPLYGSRERPIEQISKEILNSIHENILFHLAFHAHADRIREEAGSDS